MLLENQIPGRGIRVALQGLPGNPAGFGAVVRVKEGQTLGPAHVITLGNGSAGEDSPIRMIPIPKGDASLQVIWPGGQMRETKIPADATDIRVGADGSITPAR